jgi:serine/threonine-protein kinase HipA
VIRRVVVSVGGRRAGLLAAEPTGRHVYAYDPDCPSDRFVALTMPVRLESYAWHELHPVFQAALPDGADLARLAARLGRNGTRPLDVLALAGADLPGRLTVSAEAPPGHGGVADAPGGPATADADLQAALGYDANWLVPANPRGLPHLAFNRWCCLRIARRARFDVPGSELSADRATLRVARFDGAADARLGYEDFCALMGLGTAQQYEPTAERMVSAATAFVTAVQRTAVRRELFRRHALAALLRAGDAHLRTYGVLYSRADDVRLAPLHELHTTSVYAGAQEDVPPLTLGGRRSWAPKKGTWRRFGAHCALADRETQSILQWFGQALEAEIPALQSEAREDERPFLASLIEAWRRGAADLLAGF